MTDLQIVSAYISAVFKDSHTVAVQDEDGIHVLGYTIWKDGDVYRLQKMVYNAGNREEPPSEDVQDLEDSYARLDSMVQAIIQYEIQDIFADVSEGIYYQQEQELENAQDVVEG
jgi:hypothetical protein